MAETSGTVGLVPGALEGDEPGSTAILAGLLADRGIVARAIVVPDPPFGGRWGRAWTARRFALREAERPGLLHALGIASAETALELSDRWGVPYVVTVEEFLPPGASLRLGRALCRGVIAPGPALAEDLIRSLGLPARAVATIPPGIARSPEDSPARSRLTVPVIGADCGPGPGSGLATFLQAARAIRDSGIDAEFVLAVRGGGAGPRRLAEGLGLADRMTFAEGPDASRIVWGVLDVFCHPSRIPASGRSVGRAMAQGVPTIASDVPGLRDWFTTGEEGRLVPPGDPEALALAIRELLADPDAALGLGARGRGRIDRDFSPRAEAAALAELYRNALASDCPAVRPRLRPDPARRLS